MSVAFKKAGNQEIQKNKKDNVGKLQKKEKQVFSLIEKDRNQPQKININRHTKQDNSNHDISGRGKINVPEAKVSGIK